MNSEKLLQVLKEIEPAMISDRHYLHRHPELSHKEFETTEFIKKKLTEFGIEIEPLKLESGVSAIIRGAYPGKTICIRHDIDALPLEEKTDAAYASQTKGISHACGHDIHTITALYSARILQEQRDTLHGNVRVVFQPAEEVGSGANYMIRQGLMELEPHNDEVIGLHTHPMTDCGKICIRKGAMEAGSDYITIRITGHSGHGAYPHRCVDPIMTAAFVLNELQSVIARETDANKPVILTFGSIHGGNAANQIPETVELKGTMRTFYPESREPAVEAVKRIVKNVCESMRADGEVEFSEDNMPPVYNDDKMVDGITNAMTEMFGEGSVKEFEFPSPGSDDFSNFLKFSKGVQFFLGTGTDDPNTRIGLHNGRNVFPDECLKFGVGVLVKYILNETKEK